MWILMGMTKNICYVKFIEAISKIIAGRKSAKKQIQLAPLSSRKYRPIHCVFNC